MNTFCLSPKPPLLLSQTPPSVSSARKHPLLEPLKDRLLRYLDHGRIDHAFHLLDEMPLRGVPPDLVTYSVLLKSCIRRRDLRRGKMIHHRLLESKLEFDSVVRNSLVALYSKCGEWEIAQELFDEMGTDKDLVSWSAMISGLVSNGMERAALRLFAEMMETGWEPNEYCLSSVIQGCCSVEFARIGLVVFGIAIKTGYFSVGVCVGCALIDMFARTGDLESALKVFDEMPERNLVTWTLMMTRCVEQGLAEVAVDLFVESMIHGVEADQFSMSSVVTACTELGSYRIGREMHSLAIRLGLDSDVCVGCSLVDMYAKCSVDGSMSESRKVFDRMKLHNVMSWTAVITGYVHGGRDREGVDLFCKMVNGSIRPNEFTFSSVLKACANLSDADVGMQVYAHVVKSGLAAVNCVGNSLVSMFARSGRMEEARKGFDILFDKNLVSYNTIVDGYVKNSDSNEAFELLQRIGSSDYGVDAFTFASLLSAAAGIGSINRGQQLHGQVVKSGHRLDQGVSNALVSMYSRCGCIEEAWLAFNEMEDRNIISWTSMIVGFARHGYADRALRLFNKMIKSGSKPNDITYVAVLTACSHAGRISEGWEHFYSMSRDHGIVPKMDHFACMVDLLGRSGKLEEAVDLVNSMPFEAGVLVWRTILGACRVHSNMEIGEMAAREILELDPEDPAALVLLSNLYASTGQWDNVATIRSRMKQRCLTKEAGLSWMEVNNSIHEFHVGDTHHPRTRDVYAKLEEMALEIKRIGYIPDLNCVLHEVDDACKEQYLFQHSEKIAVAFGLISTTPPRPIRIFKNLRVCGDCHNAIKLVSNAYGRTIILRDSNRFHRIRDGVCSCGDYW